MLNHHRRDPAIVCLPPSHRQQHLALLPLLSPASPTQQPSCQPKTRRRHVQWAGDLASSCVSNRGGLVDPAGGCVDERPLVIILRGVFTRTTYDEGRNAGRAGSLLASVLSAFGCTASLDWKQGPTQSQSVAFLPEDC